MSNKIIGALSSMLVTVELAQKARKSGFQASCIATYYVFGSGKRNSEGQYGETEPYLFIDGFNPETYLDLEETEETLNKGAFHYLDVPIYQQLIDWFREVHKIKIDVGHSDAVGTTKVILWRWNFDNNIGKWERIGIIQSNEDYYESARIGLEKAFTLLDEKSN